ncbi:M-phase phosphoprotein 9 [Manis javanica]|nr:M-phase phosphoprotein 9 [Manis javanica]
MYKTKEVCVFADPLEVPSGQFCTPASCCLRHLRLSRLVKLCLFVKVEDEMGLDHYDFPTSLMVPGKWGKWSA